MVLVGPFALLLVVAAASAQEVQFNRDVRPILSDKCFHCHGPDKNHRFANMRLDLRESAIERGAIVPGDPDHSKLVQRIYSDDPAFKMPAAWSNKKLSESEKATLKRWIAEGAEYERHWAYIPPERPEAPGGPAGIDTLIERKLSEHGLEPVEQADRRTLIRRLSFDLTGLPPSPAEVQAFVNDSSPDAYAKLVDRLLSSPHYGERMAVWWLDLVRYADTVGYHSDVPVNVHPYRDYVIRAFNENKPFDEFTREQIAGDLLPDAALEQRVASAYNRLARMTNEGGAQAGEYLVKYAADRVRTTSTTWLGSTMGCAECHDHKFDPIKTRDFYSMGAFFADIEEKGVYPGRTWFGPSVQVPSDEGLAELKRIEQELQRLRRQRGEVDLVEYVAYEREALEQWEVAKAANIESEEGLKFDRLSDDSYQARGEQPGDDVHEIELKPKTDRVTALLLEALPFAESLAENEPWEDNGFLLSRAEVLVVDRNGRESPAPIHFALTDYEKPPYQLARSILDEEDQTTWGAAGEDKPPAAQIAFLLKEPVELEGGESLHLRLIYRGRPGNTVLGRFRLSATAAEHPELPPSSGLRAAVAAVGDPSPELQAYARHRAGGNPHWREILRLERRRREIRDTADECLVTRATEPRTVRVLPRGDWMNDSGEVVQPQVPEFLGPLETSGERLTRLDLADWLVTRDNPLTARVFVNRLWKMFFGTGISKTLDDLGSQGEPPVNRDLLDWLAVEFMESGWDVKHMVRAMVLSETYRRSSEATPELLEADPYNRYHARQTMMRLDAEFIRDNALAVSELLNREMGGPSVRPYQPAGYYRELNFPKRTYKADYNENQYRRGLYTHWQRTFLHPSLMAFDAPSREECTAERSVSNTPLQSLTLLNDPTYVEAARKFAVRMIEEGGADAADRIAFAFREAFSRRPLPEEQALLEDFVARQFERYEGDEIAAYQLSRVGLWRPPGDVDTVELAAWTAVARAIFNKHEFIMRY